jgi:hypothetical protein
VTDGRDKVDQEDRRTLPTGGSWNHLILPDLSGPLCRLQHLPKTMVEYAAVAGSASAAYAGNSAGDGALPRRPLTLGDGPTSIQANKTQAAFVPKLYS